MAEDKKFAVISHDTLRVFKFNTKDELMDSIIAIRRREGEFTAFKYRLELSKWTAFESWK